MKHENPIRDAIDESLSGVRFNAQDMRSVLRATRTREAEPAVRPRRRLRFDMAFACALLLILVVPISFFALRAQSTRTANVVTAQGGTAVKSSALPQEDIICSTASPARTAEESEAIRIARACFEAHCDTSVFSFEEYAVSVSSSEKNGGTQYTVDMTCVYGNGCRFTVVIDMPSGEVVQYSTPALATVPTYLDSSAPEIQAWYAKNGPYIFTWPAEDQAEFSRRYEGGTLRLPREGELTFEQAADLARQTISELLGYTEPLDYVYPVLYSENTATGKPASYVVYCCQSPVTDTLPSEGFAAAVTFLATGENPVIDEVISSGE